MNELSKIIDSLEVKFFKMSKKLENLEKVNTELTQELAMIRMKCNKNEKIRLLQNELESLK